MEIKDQVKLAQHIFRLLKVSEIVFPIGRTNKGNLGLKFSQNSDDYEIMLDAVPLSVKSMLEDDNNIELKKMIEKYWFDEIKGFASQVRATILRDNPLPMPIEDSEPNGGTQFYPSDLKGIGEDLAEVVDNGTTVVTITEEPTKTTYRTLQEQGDKIAKDIIDNGFTANSEKWAGEKGDFPLQIKKRGRPAGSKNKSNGKETNKKTE